MEWAASPIKMVRPRTQVDKGSCTRSCSQQGAFQYKAKGETGPYLPLAHLVALEQNLLSPRGKVREVVRQFACVAEGAPVAWQVGVHIDVRHEGKDIEHLGIPAWVHQLDKSSDRARGELGP
jgi:hypothetical protein